MPSSATPTGRCFTCWGRPDLVLNRYKQGLEGHLLQYKELKTVKTTIAAEGAYYKEFLPMSDWHHTGEGMQGFMNQGFSDPGDRSFQTRMRRFAGMYMGEDPDAPNYDPEHKVIRSIWNGSRGAMIRRATRYDWVGDPFKGRYHILHSAGGRDEMLDAEESYPEMLAHCAEYLHSAGDHPLNLIATQLHLNAYAIGHEDKYKKWLVEYVDAWKERTERNGGNIPSNIGPGREHRRRDGRQLVRRDLRLGLLALVARAQGGGASEPVRQGHVAGFRKRLDDHRGPEIRGRPCAVRWPTSTARRRWWTARSRSPTTTGSRDPRRNRPSSRPSTASSIGRSGETSEPGWYNWSSHRFVNELIGRLPVVHEPR